MRCLDGGSALANRNNGMIDSGLGLDPKDMSEAAKAIDRIIEACVDGFQDSMQRQSATGDVPF